MITYYITILWENDPGTRLHMLPTTKMAFTIKQTQHMQAQGHGVEVVALRGDEVVANDYFAPRPKTA